MPTPKLLSFFGVVGLSLFLVTSSRAGVPVVVDVFPPTNSVVSALTQIEVFFSEDVQGVDASDFLVNGVPAADVSFTLPNQALFRFTQPADGPVTITWAANHGIQDLSLVPNDFAGGGWTYKLDPTVAPPPIVINEFLANNSGSTNSVHPNTIRDEDGDNSDWIELYNAGNSTVDLDGWYLSDATTNLTKWRFQV